MKPNNRFKILLGSILFITLYSGALFTFAIYQPSDQMLDPTCLPTDLGCYVSGGTPSSPLNSIQYNNAGSFYGDSLFTRDATTNETMISQVQGGQTATLGMGTTAFLGVAPFAGAMRSDAGGISAVGAIDATAFSSSVYSAAMYSRDFGTNDSSLFLFQPNIINIHTDFNNSTLQSARIDLSSGANGGIDMLMRDISGSAYGFKTNLNNGFPETQIIYNSYDWNWPHVDGSPGQSLVTDSLGNLSWGNPSAGAGGSDTEVQFNSSGSLTGSSNFTWSGSNLAIKGTQTIADPTDPSNNFTFVIASGDSPEVDFNIGGVRHSVFGYDSHTAGGRLAIYNDFHYGGMYIYDTQGISFGYGVGAYAGSAFYIEQANNQVYTASGMDFGVGGAPTTYPFEVRRSSDGISAYFADDDTNCTIDSDTIGGISCSSDIRKKTGVTSFGEGLSVIRQLRPVRYAFNNTPEDRTFGFIAQEVQSVLPELVTEGVDGFLTLSYSGFTPVLTQAIQELDLKLKPFEDLTTVDNTFAGVLRTWLASAGNGIQNLFANTAHVERLCVGSNGNETCLTKDQVDQIILNSQISSTGGPTTGTGSNQTSGVQTTGTTGEVTTGDSTSDLTGGDGSDPIPSTGSTSSPQVTSGDVTGTGGGGSMGDVTSGDIGGTSGSTGSNGGTGI